MRAIDFHEHMRKVGTWVDWDGGSDRFIIGDPEVEVKAVAVAWQARTSAVMEALRLGCNLLVTHEPTFYHHRDSKDSVFDFPFAAEKRRLIEDSKLVIYRCHDVWDQMPEIGIVDSWAAHLELGKAVAQDRFEKVYPAPKTRFLELANHVLERTRELGQDAVQIVGDPSASVSKVAIGCGAIIIFPLMSDLGADAIIATQDGMRFWDHGAWIVDKGMPLIIVDHCVAEEPGIKNLAKYIGETFGVSSAYIPQGPMYKTIVPPAGNTDSCD